jgi:cytidine deaminase
MKTTSSISIEYTDYDSLEELKTSDKELLELAIEAAKKAYAPYSNFSVGAAIRLEDESTVIGSNQENVAYPSGLCAERVALFAAGANYPEKRIKTLAIYALKSIGGEQVSPCGSCRQVMAESEQKQREDIRVLLMNAEGNVRAFKSAADLLPLAFRFGTFKKE